MTSRLAGRKHARPHSILVCSLVCSSLGSKQSLGGAMQPNCLVGVLDATFSHSASSFQLDFAIVVLCTIMLLTLEVHTMYDLDDNHLEGL